MTARQRTRLLARLLVTPRRHRDLEKAFVAEMRALRRRLKEPHPRETLEQFVERLFVQFEATLKRYEQVFTVFRKPSPRGRRPTLAREPNGTPGRRRRSLAERVAMSASRDGRKIPDVAREVLRDELKKHDPRRYATLMALAQDHQDHATAYRPSDQRALTRAFSDERFCRQLEALVRSSRNHLKRHPGR